MASWRGEYPSLAAGQLIRMIATQRSATDRQASRTTEGIIVTAIVTDGRPAQVAITTDPSADPRSGIPHAARVLLNPPLPPLLLSALLSPHLNLLSVSASFLRCRPFCSPAPPWPRRCCAPRAPLRFTSPLSPPLLPPPLLLLLMSNCCPPGALPTCTRFSLPLL